MTDFLTLSTIKLQTWTACVRIVCLPIILSQQRSLHPALTMVKYIGAISVLCLVVAMTISGVASAKVSRIGDHIKAALTRQDGQCTEDYFKEKVGDECYNLEEINQPGQLFKMNEGGKYLYIQYMYVGAKHQPPDETWVNAYHNKYFCDGKGGWKAPSGRRQRLICRWMGWGADLVFRSKTNSADYTMTKLSDAYLYLTILS